MTDYRFPMSNDNTLAVNMARLQQTIERLAAEHAEVLCPQGTPLIGKTLELKAKRAEILERRIRQLGEMLDVVQRWESEPGSFDTASNSTAANQGLKTSAGST